MFGIGMTELVVILVIALLIFGPNKLPELARSLGKGFGEFRRASYDLRQSLMEAVPDGTESETGAAQSKKAPPDTRHTHAPEAGSPRPDQAGAPPAPPAESPDAPPAPPSEAATPPPLPADAPTPTKDG